MIIEMFVFTFKVNALDMHIKKEYLEFKRLTYLVFFIVILECFSLILLNKNNFFLIDNLFIFINSFFYLN